MSKKYAEWSGTAVFDSNGERWTEDRLAKYFDKFTDVPSGPVFEAGGGSKRVAREIVNYRAGLDYRLTYTHPVTKKRIVICPQAVRDELRARGDGASARSDA